MTVKVLTKLPASRSSSVLPEGCFFPSKVKAQETISLRSALMYIDKLLFLVFGRGGVGCLKVSSDNNGDHGLKLLFLTPPTPLILPGMGLPKNDNHGPKTF